MTFWQAREVGINTLNTSRYEKEAFIRYMVGVCCAFFLSNAYLLVGYSSGSWRHRSLFLFVMKITLLLVGDML